MCPGYLAGLLDSLYVFAHKFHFDEANVCVLVDSSWLHCAPMCVLSSRELLALN